MRRFQHSRWQLESKGPECPYRTGVKCRTRCGDSRVKFTLFDKLNLAMDSWRGNLTWRGLRVASSGHGWWLGDLLRDTENSRRELASSGNLSVEKRHFVWLTWQVEYLDLEGEVEMVAASPRGGHQRKRNFHGKFLNPKSKFSM